MGVVEDSWRWFNRKIHGKTDGKTIGKWESHRKTDGKIIGKTIGKWETHRKVHRKMEVYPLVNVCIAIENHNFCWESISMGHFPYCYHYQRDMLSSRGIYRL